MLIIDLVSHEKGWNPVNHMVVLAGELLEAEVITVDARFPSALEQLWSVLHRRSRRGNEHESCLLICTGTTDLGRVLNIPDWRRRFKFLAAWVIDSFWLDWIPRFIRISQPFDQIFVTAAEDIDEWTKRTKVKTTWLPWGADVLRLGGKNPDREWDLMRVGRQPPEWDDDDSTKLATDQLGIRFHPRPDGSGMTPLENQKFLMNMYGRAKYILAFSNTAHPTKYTHPKRQYLTGRWVDALACGAIVAGIAPKEPSIDSIMWPGATLELGGISRDEGLRVISSALRSWTPAMAANNHAHALQRFDWRWRFKILAEAFGENPKSLSRELELVQAALAT